jgi:hypothetical protein
VYHKYYTSDEDRTITWDGLHGRVFYAWVLTFLLSSFTCTSNFVLYTSLDTPETFSIVFFVVMNVSYIAFTWALLRERKNLVLVTLWTNVVVYTVHFVFVHVYVMDLMFCHTGWTDARAEYETSQWSVKAPTNGGAYVV